AVRNGVPIAIDFCNPAPDADVYSIGPENFEWVVEAAANLAIERAQAHDPRKNNLTWGTFVRNSAQNLPMENLIHGYDAEMAPVEKKKSTRVKRATSTKASKVADPPAEKKK
ncbi:MAG: glutathione synthase, partial [Spirosomataceae bacterium]